MIPEPDLTGPLVSRRRAVPRLLSRAAALTFVITAYAIAAATFLLAQLLTVESVDPPKASITQIEFPRPTAGGGGPATHPPPHIQDRSTTPTASPPIRPPAPRPVVIPLAPPEATTASAIDAANASATGPTPGASTGGGSGSGPAGPGPPCTGCPSGFGTGDPSSSDDPLLDADRPDVTPPVLIAASRTIPKYPEMARLARVQGSVMLLIVIDRDGRVGEIQVLRSPDPRFGFDLSAIEAVKTWRYRPARWDGRSVSVQASVLIEFSLSR